MLRYCVLRMKQVTKMTDRNNCPNGCGLITILKKPMAILFLLPEDVCELSHLEGTETPEHMFGYVVGVCQECGFVWTTAPTYEYNYDEYKWESLQRSEESAEV